MYIVFFGTDRKSVRDATTEYIETHMPIGATLTTIEEETYESGLVSNLLGANSLFLEPQWIVFDIPSDNEFLLEEVSNSLTEMSVSTNVFLIMEKALPVALKKLYTAQAKEIKEFSLTKESKFNLFKLSDALAEKDKRRLWVLLQDAWGAGENTEAIIGVLWWQLKVMRLVTRTRTAEEAGVKQFPYNKAKQATRHFSNDELEKIATSLLRLYHDGHAGERELDLALEQWVLSL